MVRNAPPFMLPPLVALFLVVGCATTPEGRGVWVVRNDLVSPSFLDEVVAEGVRGRFNILLVQVRGRGDAYYRSDIAPRAEPLAEAPLEYDPLAYAIAKGHAAGLQVHAWVNCFYVWPYPPPYPTSPAHVVNAHPEWLIVDAEGRTLAQYNEAQRAMDASEGLYLDPANPDVRSHLLEVCKELLARYEVDGIHLDFIRYPDRRWGFNETAVAGFMARWGVDPKLLSVWVDTPQPTRFIEKKLPLHLRWHYYYASLWAEQKGRYVTELVRDLYRELKKTKPWIIISAAVFPDPEFAYYAKGQDWTTWLQEGYLDLICPMAYHGDTSRVVAQVREVVRRAKGRGVFAGLGGWIKSPEAIRDEVMGVKGVGVDGVIYFSYQGMKGCDPGYIEAIKEQIHKRRTPSFIPLSIRGDTNLSVQQEPPEENGAQLLLRSLKRQFPSMEDYKNLLDRLGITEEELLAQLQQEQETMERITKELYTLALPKPEERVILPTSVEVETIVRYCHPKDSLATRRKTIAIMQQAYEELKGGKGFREVAMRYSQKGVYPERYYLQDGWDMAAIISQLKEGEITPVVERPNGYVIYKLIRSYPPEERVYGALPWWLKRVAFQERLARLVEGWQ